MAAKKKARARKKKAPAFSFFNPGVQSAYDKSVAEAEKHKKQYPVNLWDLSGTGFTPEKGPAKKRRSGRRKAKGGFVRAKAVYVKA